MRPTVALLLVALGGTLAVLPAHQEPESQRAHLRVLRADPRNAFTYVAPRSVPRAPGLTHFATATFNVTYTGFEGYPQAQAAFQRAVDIWATRIATTVPIDIDVAFIPMSQPGVLGSAGPTWLFLRGSPASWLPVALANQLDGVDLEPNDADIVVNINRHFPSWHFGTQPAPLGLYDLATVSLHEIGHGLGFIGSADSDGVNGYLFAPPMLYDRLVVNGSGTPITSFGSGTPGLHTQLTGRDLFWIGSRGLAGNGGSWPELYAPSFWSPGSSYSHLDEAAFPPGHPSSLMTPMLAAAETVLDPGPVTLGVLDDLGWTVAGSGLPSLTVNRPTLNFGAVEAPFTPTSPQTVTVVQSESSPIPWSATANVPWLTVSPSSGSGNGTLTIGVADSSTLPPSGTVTGRVTLNATGAWNTPVVITVRLRLFRSGTTAAPTGRIDTPPDAGLAGVTGSFAVTGWAVDDVEVTRVQIFRDSVSPEPPGQVYVGDATFVPDARPDVQAAHSAMPLSYRGGWGYLLLTNMLPGRGNGTYRLRAYALDRDGHRTSLGSRTITCANESSQKPFGSIDSPAPGATISGNAYLNYGWALTPAPNQIPIDGSTITVWVDGIPLGHVNYNLFRSDIAGLFPGYANSSGAVGYRVIDTTVLDNNTLHTIAWSVTDSGGNTEGIGSRFFNVLNPVTGTVRSANAPAQTRSLETSTSTKLLVRTGFDLKSPWREVQTQGVPTPRVGIDQLGRVELRLPSTSGECRPAGPSTLVGSHFDPATRTFTWTPGPGFVGDYAITFACRTSSGGATVWPVKVSVFPRRPAAPRQSLPQVVIDVPRSGARIDGAFNIAGWAVDRAASSGTGIVTLHVWAYPVTATGYGAPMFLGVAAYGDIRPDVGDVLGRSFTPSGFSLSVAGLPAGLYDLAVFPFSSVSNAFGPASTVRVHVR